MMHSGQVNWNQVFYFSEVAGCGSIKDAAIKLDLSPSTLSEHITQLEAALNVKLFLRQHRRLTLTAEGNRLYLRAKEMFEAGQRLIDALSPIPVGTYPVKIGLVPSSSIQIAYSLISDYLAKQGPVNMKIVHAKYAELEERLACGEFDIGFSDRLPERKDLCVSPVSTSSVKFFVAPRWAEHTLSDLIGKLPLLVCNSEPMTRTVAEQALTDSGFSSPAVITSDFPSVLIELCQRGLGIGVFGEEPIRKLNVDSLRAFRVPRDAPGLQDNLYLLWAREGENRTVVKHWMGMEDWLKDGFEPRR